MKCLLRAAFAVLALVVASLTFCQSQVWSVYHSFQRSGLQHGLKMVKGPDGNFYTLSDGLVSKWDSTGNLLWTRQFDGFSTDIAVNSSWVVVIGIHGTINNSFSTGNNERRNVLLRYDLSGNGSTPVFSDHVGFNAVALTSNGDAIIAATQNST